MFDHEEFMQELVSLPEMRLREAARHGGDRVGVKRQRLITGRSALRMSANREGVLTPRLERLTVVVLNWETPDLTLRCVRALVGDGVPPERVVIVDNGSRDTSFERLQSELPACRLLRLENNVGYARGANAGARRLPGDAYLLVNSDAFVRRPGSVRLLLGALADPAVGLAVPLLLNDDLTLQPSVRPLSTPAVALLQASGLGRLLPNHWQPRWSHHWDHASSRPIEAANGAVVLVRKETWEQLGGYNERRAMYGEDSDLCWRARKLGWRIWFTEDAEFVHLGNATGSRAWTSPERARMIGREEGCLLWEQLSPLGAIVSAAGICFYLTWRAAVFALMRDRPAASATRAARSGYLTVLRAALDRLP